MIKEITFVFDGLIGLYSILPIIKEVLTRKVKVYIACREKNFNFVRKLLPDLNGQVISLEHLRSNQFYRISRLYQLIALLVTSHNFSYQYRLISNPTDHRRGSKLYKWAYFLSKYFPSLPHNTINHRLKSLFYHFIPNVFPTCRIIVVSRFSTPYLLLSKSQEIMTFLESWDHPVKFPAGYPSCKVFVWNKELGEDWIKYQGDKNIFIGYPMKLRYAICHKQRSMTYGRLHFQPRALYAAGSSSLSHTKNVFFEEIQVIREVCLATRQAGWKLLIKPKPNGVYGDFDHFIKEFDHVEIGEYSDVQITSDYYLDDEYNNRRFEQLRSFDLVINALTTFALDAAVFGIPVLQLDLRKDPKFSQLAESQTNHHIQHYLLRDSELTLASSEGHQLFEGLVSYLTNCDDRPQLFSDKLRRWLIPPVPFDEAIAAMSDAMLEEVVSQM